MKRVSNAIRFNIPEDVQRVDIPTLDVIPSGLTMVMSKVRGKVYTRARPEIYDYSPPEPSVTKFSVLTNLPKVNPLIR
jgi:hypothetical protein